MEKYHKILVIQRHKEHEAKNGKKALEEIEKQLRIIFMHLVLLVSILKFILS